MAPTFLYYLVNKLGIQYNKDWTQQWTHWFT